MEENETEKWLREREEKKDHFNAIWFYSCFSHIIMFS